MLQSTETVLYRIVEVYYALLASRYQVLPKTGIIFASYFNTCMYGNLSDKYEMLFN